MPADPTFAGMVAAGGHQVTALLGCDWGRTIALPGNAQPCPEQATHIAVLHGNWQSPRDFKLCDRHFATVQAETDPHRPTTTEETS